MSLPGRDIPSATPSAHWHDALDKNTKGLKLQLTNKAVNCGFFILLYFAIYVWK